MTLTEDTTQQLLVTHYAIEGIRIKDTLYETNILITPIGEILTWPVKTLEELDVEYRRKIIEYQPEIVIIGTGAAHQFPDLNVIRHFSNHKIGIEIMNTAAACRTYNILVLEGRQVAAGLML